MAAKGNAKGTFTRSRRRSVLPAAQQRKRFHYLLFYKPYGVLSQFTGGGGKKTLSLFGPFPPHVYPVGRLDADSEGLLLLTDDRKTLFRLTDPRFAHPRTYVVQVERVPDQDALERLHRGVMIQGKQTRPAEVELLSSEPDLPPRPVPIRFRKSVPTAWLRITLREGRNRQIRRMTAAAGYPTLRLVRVSIGPFSLRGLNPGTLRELTPRERNELVEVKTTARVASSAEK
jgi:23S rRNA pseudouridine2457 synthase